MSTTNTLLGLAALGAMALFACDESSSSSSPSSSTTASSGGGGASVGPGGAGGSGGSGGSAIEPLPPVPAACAAPVSTPGAVLNGARFDGIQVAWTGAVAAVAFAESTGDSTWDVKLQRLDGNGMAIGDPIFLGGVTLAATGIGPLPRPVISLTARGSRFVSCWTGAPNDAIACATITEDGDVAQGLLTTGKNPAVAMGPAGVGLVFVNGSELYSQRLAADGSALGSAHVVASSSLAEFPAVPVLASSDIGYVANADVFFPRFDAAFEEMEGSAAIGWTSLPVALAGSGDVMGAAWGSLEGVQARVLGPTDDDFGAAVRIDGNQGTTSAFTTALTRADGSFAALWSEDAALRYAALDLAAQRLGQPIDALVLPYRSDSLALSGVANGFIGAAATTVTQDTLLVVHLACP